MSVITEKYNKALEEFEQQKRNLFALMRENGIELLTEGLSPMIQSPITGVQWRQYTPYFNDGETCVFSVHEPEIIFEGSEEATYVWVRPDGTISADTEEELVATDELRENLKAIDSFFNSQPEDLFEIIFGDHVEVTVRMEKDKLVFTSNEVDHD